MKKIFKLSLLSLALSSNFANAELSTTVTAVSDYTFNGVSQTGNDPALQVSLDKLFDNGMYVGTWASNVDFADDTNLEWDFYLGRFISLTENVTVDYGIAYYSYHGDDNSSDGNYPEIYTKFGYNSDFGNTELNLWYSWDYFGADVGHTIVMVAHNYEIAPNHNLRASFDVSNSLDANKWRWDGENTSYHHYRLAYQTSYQGFNIEVAAENTNLDIDVADERIVMSVSKTFSL